MALGFCTDTKKGTQDEWAIKKVYPDVFWLTSMLVKMSPSIHVFPALMES